VPADSRCRTIAACALLVCGIACTSGCYSARVQWVEPKVAAPLDAWWKLSPPELDYAEQLYSAALKQEAECLASSVDLYYEVAVATWHHDGPAESGCRKRELHKSALTKLVVAGQQFGRLDPRHGLMIRRNGHKRWIPLTRHGFVWEPQAFDSFHSVGPYRTKAIRKIYRCAGVGVPLIVTSGEPEEGTFLTKRPVFAATLRMNVHRCGAGAENGDASGTATSDVWLELYDPLRVDKTVSDTIPQPIAKDLSAPLAYRIENDPRSILAGFLDPASPAGQSRLHMIEPYQPGKIPIVFIHGLLSDPFTWGEMINELQAQPGFVDHFQMWVFEYPTGQAFLSSAARLREQLQLARQTFDPDRQDQQFANIVLVGHSMGGLIAKLQVTGGGDQLWQAVANRPLDQVVMQDQLRRNILASFYFTPSPDVSRVIFLGTPHRGSVFARRLIGRIGSALVSEPEELQQAHAELIRRNPGVFSEEVSRRIPTGIDLLEPSSQLLQAMARLPASCRVRMHSIIGNSRHTIFYGRSDGMVPVTSARESRAISERLIKTRHTELNDHPESVEEISSILRRHLEESGGGNGDFAGLSE
jgi:pimeloyl-ACP methyl ester carboxylesterase